MQSNRRNRLIPQIYSKPSLGLVGFGVFGRLVAHHLAQFFEIVVFDPRLPTDQNIYLGEGTVRSARIAEAASQNITIFAVPTSQLRGAVRDARDYFAPGSLVLDVASVKVTPSQIFVDELPSHVVPVCTHPLFGPQSSTLGIVGHKIVLCPVDGTPIPRSVIRFLQTRLKLQVFLRSPEEHDRELATVQGVTHLVAQIISRMNIEQGSLSTRSFELLMSAIDMVRNDSAEVFYSICAQNPFAKEIRDEFIMSALQTRDMIDRSFVLEEAAA